MKITHMKRTLGIIAIAAFMLGCQSPSEKEEKAKVAVTKAQEDLKAKEAAAAADVIKQSEEAEWKALKSATEAAINANDLRIVELRAKKSGSAKTVDQINALEKSNKDLKTKLDNYEKNRPTDWAAFKREMTHDMEAIAEAFKELGQDNKK
ncbi:MAG: hypothetical protein ACKVOK_11985 [Flavobacteriales bacterium]